MYRNKKAFLYQSRYGSYFIVVFVADEQGRLLGRTIGYRAFPNNDFAPIASISQATAWLNYQGHTYIKRLPLIVNGLYDFEQVYDWLSMVRIAASKSAA